MTLQVIRVPFWVGTAVRISVPSSFRSVSQIRANSVELDGSSTISSEMYSNLLFMMPSFRIEFDISAESFSRSSRAGKAGSAVAGAAGGSSAYQIHLRGAPVVRLSPD